MKPPFAIGSPVWPGLSKLTEEAGEVQQVVGKLMGTGGLEDHWNGTNLRTRLIEEMGDVLAAIAYVVKHNGIDDQALEKRFDEKLALFEQWHDQP
jgi:NTP pyrophosphatase (non-canonical NTP hydrolase)